MRKTLLVAGAFALLASAGAQARPRTIDMSCGEASFLVGEWGALLLSTYPNQFDRYVRDLGFCPVGMQLLPQWVPTQDDPECFVGYTCVEPSVGGPLRE